MKKMQLPTGCPVDCKTLRIKNQFLVILNSGRCGGMSIAIISKNIFSIFNHSHFDFPSVLNACGPYDVDWIAKLRKKDTKKQISVTNAPSISVTS